MKIIVSDDDDTVGLSSPVGAPAPSPTAAPAFAPQPPPAALPWWMEEDNELCDGSCMQSATCRLDHMCPGRECAKVRGVRKGVPHRVPRSGFGETLGCKRHKNCMQGNEAAKAKPEYGESRKRAADKRAEEAMHPPFDVTAVAPQEIALLYATRCLRSHPPSAILLPPSNHPVDPAPCTVLGRHVGRSAPRAPCT